MVTDLERQLNVQSIEFLFVSITVLFFIIIYFITSTIILVSPILWTILQNTQASWLPRQPQSIRERKKIIEK